MWPIENQNWPSVTLLLFASGPDKDSFVNAPVFDNKIPVECSILSSVVFTAFVSCTTDVA